MHLNPSTFFPIHINVFREAVADGAVAVSVAWWQEAADNSGMNHFYSLKFHHLPTLSLQRPDTLLVPVVYVKNCSYTTYMGQIVDNIL